MSHIHFSVAVICLFSNRRIQPAPAVWKWRSNTVKTNTAGATLHCNWVTRAYNTNMATFNVYPTFANAPNDASVSYIHTPCAVAYLLWICSGPVQIIIANVQNGEIYRLVTHAIHCFCQPWCVMASKAKSARLNKQQQSQPQPAHKF